jgi:predicted membrane protein
VMIDVTGTPDAISVNSVSGDTTIRIPEAVGARYRVNTVSGKVQLDNMTVVGGMGKGYTGTSGSLNGTWVEISVNSVSGDAAVLRSSANAPSSDSQPSGAEDAASQEASA